MLITPQGPSTSSLLWQEVSPSPLAPLIGRALSSLARFQVPLFPSLPQAGADGLSFSTGERGGVVFDSLYSFFTKSTHSTCNVSSLLALSIMVVLSSSPQALAAGIPPNLSSATISGEMAWHSLCSDAVPLICSLHSRWPHLRLMIYWTWAPQAATLLPSIGGVKCQTYYPLLLDVSSYEVFPLGSVLLLPPYQGICLVCLISSLAVLSLFSPWVSHCAPFRVSYYYFRPLPCFPFVSSHTEGHTFLHSSAVPL